MSGRIVVFAGPNGAGKSSIIGENFRELGGSYHNPDEMTKRFEERFPHLTHEEANSRAWRWGRRELERAISERSTFVFETTLGGRTITDLLIEAARQGLPVHLLYVALATPELHIARVAARVKAGGHAIPLGRIRERYDTGRQNVIRLLPHLAELKLFDNSSEADPRKGKAPKPRLVLHLEDDDLIDWAGSPDVPEWSKPIVAAIARRRGGMLRLGKHPRPSRLVR